MECKTCSHKHNHWDGDSFGLTHTETEKFIRINGNFTVNKDYGYVSEVALYACPKCFAVIMNY